jgi:hypothetical protein
MDPQSKKSLIDRLVKGKEDSLIESYIVDGPSKLRAKIEVSAEEWSVFFDYLVFEENLLYKCVVANSDFFVDIYIKFGSTHVREVLDIEDAKYDVIWEMLFDFIAIANEGLYYHAVEHRDKYMTAMKARGSDFVRKVLGVSKGKYEENWAKVLDFLLNAVCDAIFSESTYEHGLQAFAMMMNGVREQRALNRFGVI